MEENPLVFGISTGVFDNAPYTFLDVLGVATNGRIHILTDPKEQFPERGSVFLSQDFWIPPEGQAAVWRVAANQSDEHTAKYRVISRGRAGPKEILSVPYPSSEPDRIREYLIEGIRLRYVPNSEVLIELRDGVVIGPVRADLTRAHNLRAFFCSEDAFHDPLGRWENASELEPIDVVYHGERRRFTSFLELPSAGDAYDLAAFETKVEIVLRFLAREGVLKEMTRVQIDAVSELLRDVRVPQRVAARAEEVLTAASNAVLMDAQVARIVDGLLETSQVKVAFERERARARRNEIQRLESERADVYSAVEDLRNERDRLEREVEKRRLEADRVSDVLVHAIEERVRIAQDDATDLLATVAVLRPFLNSGAKSSETKTNSEALARPDAILPSVDFDQARATLTANLEAIGIRPVAATALSAEVLAAVLSGQLAVFSGSIASLVARTCARALAAESSRCIRVPVGLLGSSAIEQELSALEKAVEQSGIVAAMVFEGMNRSAFEIYGDGLRERSIESTMLRQASRGVICFGTVVAGPGTLPPSKAMAEIGPVFDSDYLPMRIPKNPGRVQGATIVASDWAEWSRAASEASPKQREEVRRIVAAAGRPNPLWEATLDRAHRALSRLVPEEATASPLVSLCFGWIVPHVSALRADPDAVLNAVKAEIEEIDAVDDRLIRMLEAAVPGEGRR